jgi:hypothetical protein
MSDSNRVRDFALYIVPVAVLLLIGLGAAFVMLRDTSSAQNTTATPYVPGDMLDITMVPYETNNFTSVRPAGWRDAGGGAYAYLETDYGLVQRHIPAPGISFVQPGVEEDMNFTQHEGQVDEREVNGLRWRIYRGQTDRFEVDYALADGGALSVYMILMQVPPSAYDTLHERLFLEALENFQPK